jgi:hypothetical protein
MATKPVVTLSGHVRAAVNAAPWLTDADAGAIALAVLIAESYELETDLRALPRLAAELRAILKDLGLSVAGRTDPAESKTLDNPLDELRRRARLTHPATRKQSSKKIT